MLYDKDIREPLFEFLEDKYGKTRIFEEKMMGKSRADILVVTEDEIIGIEIKSDADTYVRLARQVKDYDKYFDRNYVVVGSHHGAHVEEHVPSSWGIITVEEIDGRPDFYVLREARANEKMELRNKLSLLWRMELAHIQELNSMCAYKQKSKLFVIDKICEKVDVEILNRQISDELFERDYSTVAEKIATYRAENNQNPRRKKKMSKKYRLIRL